MKKEICCPTCDNFFTISFKSGDPILYCPFCSDELIQEDTNDFDEEEC